MVLSGRFKYDFCPKIHFISPGFLLFRPQVITLGLLACAHFGRPLRHIVWLPGPCIRPGGPLQKEDHRTMEKFFQLKANGTTAGREVVAGLTT